jgi:phosphoribosylformylglycinamidine cyclo-ligase
MDYKSSGVNIDEGNRAVDTIKPLVQSTHSKHVLSNIGGFAAGFQFPFHEYKNPILVSSTDGVGTKILLALQHNALDRIGIDCVAMCVNDLICMGADPLFFLDYIACHSIQKDQMKTIISGLVDGCKQAGCSLIGGEMAEMNVLYKPNDVDIAGFCVGVVEKDDIIDGAAIKEGDHIYALPSSGCHSNGYSLVRNVVNNTQIVDDVSIQEFLEPTIIYVDAIKALKQRYTLHGIANITGGGIHENLERVLPEKCHANIVKSSIKTQEIFHCLQKYGNIPDADMQRTFNMGVGMIVVSPDEINQEDCYKIGEIISGEKGVTYV